MKGDSLIQPSPPTNPDRGRHLPARLTPPGRPVEPQDHSQRCLSKIAAVLAADGIKPRDLALDTVEGRSPLTSNRMYLKHPQLPVRPSRQPRPRPHGQTSRGRQ